MDLRLCKNCLGSSFSPYVISWTLQSEHRNLFQRNCTIRLIGGRSVSGVTIHIYSSGWSTFLLEVLVGLDSL